MNLQATRPEVLRDVLAMHAGEPYRISVRQMLRLQPEFSHECVFVCENPSVLAAAANALGPSCAPLVCIEGQLRSAAHLLLSRLSQCGVPLFYHGDFDWPGLRIASLVMQRYGARPWRMSGRDYAQAVTEHGLALTGRAVETPWDATLSPSMLDRGHVVHEEQVLSDLLLDLGYSVSVR